MKSKLLKVCNFVNWTFLAIAALFVATMMLGGDGGGGTFSAIATVTALTAILWVPIVFIIALISFVMELRVRKYTGQSWTYLLKRPSTYIVLLMLTLLYVMFS